MKCRVAQLEDLTFKQQMAVYAESQVVIMTHGAALGNVLFMSPVSQPPPLLLPPLPPCPLDLLDIGHPGQATCLLFHYSMC